MISDHPDFGLVVAMAVRYSIGRDTYAVDAAIEFAQRAWPLMTEGDRAKIVKDVTAEMVRDDFPSPTRARQWQDFYRWVRSRANLEETHVLETSDSDDSTRPHQRRKGQ